MQEVFGSIIGGHQVLEALGPSGRFIAFRVKMRGPNSGLGRLYLLSEPLLWPERFHEAVHLVHTRYPFDLGSERALILPEPQLWDARPWFVVPDGARVLGQYGAVTLAALESLRQQLQWLTELSVARPGVTSGPFAHGDNSRDRILLINDRDARLIAPAWIAATELALQRDLARAREDDRCLVEQLVEAMQRRSLPPEPVAVESARVDDNEIACQKCGKRNPKQYKFCIGCGASLSMPPARPAAITLSSIPPRALPVPPVLPARHDSSVPPRSRPSILKGTATTPAAATATTLLQVVNTAAIATEKKVSTRPPALTIPEQSSPPSVAPPLPENELANRDSTASILPSVPAAPVRPSSIPI